MSLTAEMGYGVDRLSALLELPLRTVHPTDNLRSGGLNEEHVRLLMETVEQWPPIVVWDDECVVVDGAHRVEAARRLGLRTIAAVRFVGSREEAFLESVRRNVDHGLPLTIGDRRRAAIRVLTRNAHWSDRRVASLCGLSGKTVARLRREHCDHASTVEAPVIGLERRVGRDGKVRPVQAGEIRDRIRRALEKNPGGSLREIATIAGASPETVRTVRARLVEGEKADSKPHAILPTGTGSVAGTDAERTVGINTAAPDLRLGYGSRPVRTAWIRDPALVASADGGAFAGWFANTNVDEEWHRYVWAIPLGRVYEVVDEARRRAATWTAFASLLESRTR